MPGAAKPGTGPASPKFDHRFWGGYIQRIDFEQSHHSLLETLTNKLFTCETDMEDIPALVGVQDLRRKVWIVSGNRCLEALRAFADRLREEEGIQCVEVKTLLVSLSDMDLFPQSLFACC